LDYSHLVLAKRLRVSIAIVLFIATIKKEVTVYAATSIIKQYYLAIYTKRRIIFL